MLTIAIDIDGVITDLDKFRKDEGSIYFDKSIVNARGNDVDEIFGVTKKMKDKFWKEKYRNYISSCPARFGVAAATHELAHLGYRIIIVTARKFKEGRGFASREELEESTRNNLIANDIYFDELHFVSYPKAPIVGKYKIDIFIEDDIKNIATLAEHTKVIIMDSPYNRTVSLSNTKRIYSWNEVVEAIELIEHN